MEKKFQLWKLYDKKANKSGAHHTVYWVQNNKKWLENKRIGMSVDGVSKLCTGKSYKGDWNGNQKDGYGTQVGSDGRKYEGEWKGNKRNGKGTSWVVRQGKLHKEYTGDWVDNMSEGLGVFYYRNGNRYEGQWVGNKRQGRGKLNYECGDVYEGDWLQDERCGPGILVYENGNRYEGHWLNDKKEGPGRFYYQNTGKIYIGEWAEDVPKCGTYMDLPKSLSKTRGLGEGVIEDHFELPPLGLVSTNDVLVGAMTMVRKDRAAARAPIVELEDVFTNEELGQLGEAWLSMDPEDSGKISAPELNTVLAGLGVTPSEEEFDIILKSMGVERSGSVTWEMFVNLMAELKSTN